MKPTYLKPQPCKCPEPVGDLRDGTCILCGHQAPGFSVPAGRVASLSVGVDHSTFATPQRKYRPAA